MFTTNLHFDEILTWFKGSQFEYLLLFLPSYDTKDREFDDYIIQDQRSIDQLTGEQVAYLAYADEKMEESVYRITRRQLNRDSIRTHVDISNEVREHYSFGLYNLPALILISKEDEYNLFPIKTQDDLDSYFKPIGIVTSFKIDYYANKRERYRFESLDIEEESFERSISYYEEKNRVLEEFVHDYDKDFAIRIDTNYRQLFNYLKRRGVRQNIFDAVFTKLDDEDAALRQLIDLGLEDNYLNNATELIKDLKKVPNFERFESRYGCVAAQIERLYNLCLQEIATNTDAINKDKDALIELGQRQLIAPIKLKELDEEQEVVIENYAKAMNKALFIVNGREILLNVLNSNSKGLIDILKSVRDRTRRLNLLVENLKMQIAERGYDVFISSKSEDYDRASEVYCFLKDNGYRPFLADKELRELGSPDYGQLIRLIINQCKYLIVYASKAEYLSTTYVSAEWNQFLDELSSGLKKGKLYSIISSDIKPDMLPPGLSTKQFFTIENYKDTLLNYLTFS